MTPRPYPEPAADDEPVDIGSVDYFRRLEQDLVAAAASHGARRRRPALLRPVALGGAAATVFAVAFVALQSGGSEQMADAIDIQRLDGETVIVIDELIDDPKSVEQELADAGIPAAIRGALAPPPQVGALITDDVRSLDGQSGGPKLIDEDDDGTVDRIVVPDGYAGSLELVVGVAAGADTAIEASAPIGCADLVGSTFGDVASDLRALSDEVAFYRYGADGEGFVDEAAVPVDDVVIEVLVSGDGSLLVTLADEPDRVPPPAVSPCER